MVFRLLRRKTSVEGYQLKQMKENFGHFLRGKGSLLPDIADSELQISATKTHDLSGGWLAFLFKKYPKFSYICFNW